MLKAAVKKVLGSRHIREAKKLQPLVEEINELFEEYQSLSEEQLKGKTDEFRAYVADTTAEIKDEMEELREEKRHSEDPMRRQELQEALADLDERLVAKIGDVLEELLPQAFATVKETCRRLMGTEVSVTGQTSVWDMVPYDVQLVGAIALAREDEEDLPLHEASLIEEGILPDPESTNSASSGAPIGGGD